MGLKETAGCPTLEFTPEVERATAEIYERVRTVIPPIEWAVHAPHIAAINDLKKSANAIILAHNYQVPEIYSGVADYRGDSLGLARKAAETDADVIVVCGVHFMAETAKILCPEKTVLIPDLNAGCSLADSITAPDVQELKRTHPGVPVVTYVNTSAEVKAESDICCTSGNAVEVVESLNVDRVIFLPDEYFGHYVAQSTDTEIILWHGHCEVHERFSATDLEVYRKQYPGLQILAHPECKPDVLASADFVGSTSAMEAHVRRTRPARILMATECSMSDNLAAEFPDLEFVRPCALCPHMKRITLPRILNCLQAREHEIRIDPDVSERSRTAVARMLNL